MRQLLVLLAVLVIAVLAVLLLTQDPTPQTTPEGTTDTAAVGTTAPEPAEATRKRQERDRLDTSRRDKPELQDAQLREQDPKLARITGRAMLDPRRAALDAEVEIVREGRILARVPTGDGGRFEVKNLPPGRATLLTASAPNHAPGGVTDLVLRTGQTVNVGTLYLGVAIDPSVDNRLRVRVTGPEGDAVEAARVTLTTQSYSTFVSLGPYDKQPGGVVLRKETDARGEAVFAPIPPGTYDLFVQATGLTFETKSRFVVQSDTKETLDLELERAQSIVGTVLDPQGEPLEGAMVIALRFGDFSMFPGVESGPDGKFEIEGLSGGNFMVFALADGIGGSDQRSVQPGGEEIELRIQPGGDLKVRIVEQETGEPVTSFGLRPFRTGPFGYLYAPLLEFETDDGVAEVTLPETSYGLEVVASGYRVHQEATIPLNPEGPVEIQLEKGGMIHGKVLTKSGGEPIVGATIYIRRGGFPATPHKALQTVTDANGLFTLEGLGLDPTNIRITHVDHTEESFAGVQPVDVTAPDGELPQPEEFRLGVGGVVEGRVFGDDALPAAGETMYLTLPGFDFSFNRSTTVDAQGRYRFEHVPVDRTYTVSVRSFMPGSGGRSQSDVRVTEGGTTTVDFGREGGGVAVSGTVMQDGAPRPGVSLTLTATDGRSMTVQGRSDDQGAFTFENVPPGEYQITSQSSRRVTVEFAVPDEGAPEPLVIDLVGSGVSGSVVDARTGEPIDGVYVDVERVLEDDGASLVDVQRKWKGGRLTSEGGTFAFAGLQPGRYRLRAQRDGFGAAVLDQVVVVEGEVTSDLVLELGPEGSIAGRVTDANGDPVEGAALEIVDEAGRNVFMISMTQSSSDGTFAQGGLAPGTYEVTLKKDGHAPASRTLTVRAGEATEAEFILLRGGEIEVTALTSTGEPVQDAVVVLRDDAGERVTRGLTIDNLFSLGQTRTDRFGRVTLSGLAPGRYRVAVTSGGVTSPAVDADVVESGSTAVEVTFSTGSGE